MEQKLIAAALCLAATLGTAAANAALLPVSPSSWTTQTVNNASASVSASNEVELRVFKTSYATARADLGILPGAGTLSVAFDWTIRADGWYETSSVTLDTDGTNTPVVPLGGCATVPGLNCAPSGLLPVGNAAYLNLGCGSTLNCSPAGLVLAYPHDFRVEPVTAPLEELVSPAYGVRSGHASVSQGASGQTYLNFLLVPSPYSENGDHANTYFSVRNLQLTFTPTATPVPLPTAAFLLAPALGGLGFMRRRAT